MTGVEHSVEVRAPIDTVFAEITDPRRAADWNPGIVEVRNLPRALMPGATWTQVVSMLGRHAHLTCRVLRYEPPHYGEIEISGDQRGRVWTRCEERAGSTHVTQGIEFSQPEGRLKALAGVAARTMVKRELNAAMSRQRDTLEREAGGENGAPT